MIPTKKLLKYSAGAAAFAPFAHGGLVIETIDTTVGAGSNSHIQLTAFDDGAGAITLTSTGGHSDNLRFYSGTQGVYFEGENYGGVDLQFFYVSGAGGREAVNLNVGDTWSGGTGAAAIQFVSVANSDRTFRNSFVEGSTDYTGFSAVISGRTHYGWIEFTTNLDNSMTLNRFAIETSQNTGALISASAVPEPASAAFLLAAGALGMATIRRKRGIKVRPEID